MSLTAEIDDRSLEDTVQERQFEYRALHTGAIVGVVLGVLSVFTVFAAANTLEGCLMIAPIPLVGMFVSLRAWSAIARNRDQYTGSKFAIAGFTLSLLFLVTGVGYGTYVYATEVPDGYTRISFASMNPGEADERADRFWPPEIQDLIGKRVFIKGYCRPGTSTVRTGMEKFLLVRDNNECCFGDISKVKYFDQMQVVLKDSLRLDYSTRLYRLGGILHAQPANLALDRPVFFLEADYAQ